MYTAKVDCEDCGKLWQDSQPGYSWHRLATNDSPGLAITNLKHFYGVYNEV